MNPENTNNIVHYTNLYVDTVLNTYRDIFLDNLKMKNLLYRCITGVYNLVNTVHLNTVVMRPEKVKVTEPLTDPGNELLTMLAKNCNNIFF